MFRHDGFYRILNTLNLARFRNFDFKFSLRDKYFNKTSGAISNQTVTPDNHGVLPQSEQSTATNRPQDIVEISAPDLSASTDAPKSATYSLPDIMKSSGNPDGTESEIASETAPEDPPADESQVQQTPVEKKWLSLIDLNMRFNLVEFEKTLKGVLQDAEDGEIDEASLTKIALGLHVDLKARARVDEVYQSAETADAQINEIARTKIRARQALRAMVQTRDFEARMFYKESLKSSSTMKRQAVDGFLRVSRKLTMRYSQDFSLRLSSLRLFNSQAQALDQSGDAGAYVNSTENLVDNPQTSGDLIGKFFEAVQGYLDNSKSMISEKIDQFFNNLADELGLDDQLLQGVRDSLLANVNAFFDRVDSAMAAVTDKYVLPTPAPEPAAPLPEPAANDVTSEETQAVAA